MDDVFADVTTVLSRANTINAKQNAFKCIWDTNKGFGLFDQSCWGGFGANASLDARAAEANRAYETYAFKSNTAQEFNKAGIPIPTEYALRANYPNPFNPETTVEFDLPEAGPVTLTVYDVQGRAVATLISQDFVAGTHQVVWNAGRLASGTYLYRLEAGRFVQTKQMLLVK